MNIYKFETLESTNTFLKDHIHDYKDRDVIFAFNQTKGHGRINRPWSSNKDSLTFSILFKDDFLYNNYDSLSIISAVSVMQVLQKKIDNVLIKWPNDIMVNNKKICGILAESRISNKMDGLILGIGLNVNNKSFDASLNATSLYIESNKEEDIELLLNEILQTLFLNIELLKKGLSTHIEFINKNNYLYNKYAFAVINNKKELVKVLNVSTNNNLIVELNNEKIEVSTDEISFHKN
jgi:BirA family biotin operon repressor/biotin-[acetyl-CoA-carboxylase] ligase